jgi:hypothetical protein
MDQFMLSTSIIGFPERVYSGKNGKVKRITGHDFDKAQFFWSRERIQ